MGRGDDGDASKETTEAAVGTGRGDAAAVLSAAETRGNVRMVMWDGTEISNTDVTATRNEWLFKPPQPLRGMLESTVQHERDYPMIYLIFNITVTVLPSAAAQYRFADQLPWWVGPAHVVMIVSLLSAAAPPRNHSRLLLRGCSQRSAFAQLRRSVSRHAQYALFLQRYILCLHYSEHRKIFKKKYAFLNKYLQNVVAPFMGLPTGARSSIRILVQKTLQCFSALFGSFPGLIFGCLVWLQGCTTCTMLSCTTRKTVSTTEYYSHTGSVSLVLCVRVSVTCSFLKLFLSQSGHLVNRHHAVGPQV